jgi:phage host-nuclease inhibitor protein Gam
MNALQKHELDEMEGLELNEETKQRFKIEDKEQLNWALRKLSALESEQKEIDELAAKEMERINVWRVKEVEGIKNSKGFFEGLIAEYAMSERTKDPKFKSVSSPYGKVTFKKQSPKWHYEEDKLVEYLESINQLDLIRVKKEPNKAELKKRLKVLGKVLEDGRVLGFDGSLMDGVTVEHLDEKLEIKAGD